MERQLMFTSYQSTYTLFARLRYYHSNKRKRRFNLPRITTELKALGIEH